MSKPQVSPVSKEMKLFLYKVASDIEVFKEEIASLRSYLSTPTSK